MAESTSAPPAAGGPDDAEALASSLADLPADFDPAQGFVTPPLRARHVYLKPITPSDYPFLQMLETAGELAPRWRHRGATPNPEQWAQTLWQGVLVQFMVVGISSNKPIGRVVIYQPNFQDGYAYFAAMRFEPGDRSPLMILGISLFLRYVFSYWAFDKLYMEVPEYNLPQFASGLGRFFVMEGRIRGHFKVGGRSWDQLILALYRETAIQEGARLRLDHGARSDLGADPAVVEPGTAAEILSPPSWQTVGWDQFVVTVAQIAQLPATDIRPDSRVLEDLALDSLALAELGVVLVDKYDTWSLSQDLELRSWNNITVRELYDEYLSGAPSPASTTTGSDPGAR